MWSFLNHVNTLHFKVWDSPGMMLKVRKMKYALGQRSKKRVGCGSYKKNATATLWQWLPTHAKSNMNKVPTNLKERERMRAIDQHEDEGTRHKNLRENWNVACRGRCSMPCLSRLQPLLTQHVALLVSHTRIGCPLYYVFLFFMPRHS